MLVPIFSLSPMLVFRKIAHLSLTHFTLLLNVMNHFSVILHTYMVGYKILGFPRCVSIFDLYTLRGSLPQFSPWHIDGNNDVLWHRSISMRCLQGAVRGGPFLYFQRPPVPYLSSCYTWYGSTQEKQLLDNCSPWPVLIDTSSQQFPW